MERHGQRPTMEGSPADPAMEWSSRGGETGLEEPMWQLGLVTGSESYPERPNEANCICYPRAGFCGYGARCRFNHPCDHSSVVGAIRPGRGEFPEQMGQPLCQYYMRTGTCKFGASCKYHHPRWEVGSAIPVSLNIAGYPLRPGEKECSNYLKTGQCRFGVTCNFHHPQPAGPLPVPSPVPALACPSIHSASVPTPQQYGMEAGNWQVARPAFYLSSYLQRSPMALPPFSGWNPYQTPATPLASPSAQSTVGTTPIYVLSPSAPAYTGAYLSLPSSAGPSSSSQKKRVFPRRPGQPECQYYIKTGDCRFGSSCRFHHPAEWSPPRPIFALSPMGLPLRPVLYEDLVAFGSANEPEKITYETSSNTKSIRHGACISFLNSVRGLFKILTVGEADVELINNLGFFNLDSMKDVEVCIANCTVWSRKRCPIQILCEDYIYSTYFPGREVPHWLSFKNAGSTISFTMTLPPHLYFRGLNLCLVYTLPVSIDWWPVPLHVEFSSKSSGMKMNYKPTCYGIPEIGGYMVWLIHCFERNLFREGDEVQVRFKLNGGEIKECGVHLLYFEEVEEIHQYWSTLCRSGVSNAFQFVPFEGFPTPDKQHLSSIVPKSRGEEDSERLQLQVPHFFDGTIGGSDHKSPMGTAPEGGLLSMEEGQKLSSEEKEVSNSYEKEVSKEVSVVVEDLEKIPLDPLVLEELDNDPMEVPPPFSHHFPILHILDLSYTEINSLPQSISRLIALRKLILRGCELLMELPPEIGELMNLEVLDLEGTEILFLPKEIAKLVNLTCLKVSFYGHANQTVIPRRTLSNLSRLKELIIDVTPYGEWWDDEVEAMINDMSSLKELRTLKFCVPFADLLEGLTLIFPDLANFRFTIGHHEEHFISRLPRDIDEEFNNWEKLQKGLKYVNGSCIPNETTKVFKQANAFFLQRHWTAKSLSEFGHENMGKLKFCLVMECNEFQTTIDFEYFQGEDGSGLCNKSDDFQDSDEAIVLGSLEKLIIRYMKNMESICKGPFVKGCMSNLKSLALHTCPNLTILFTINMLTNLINLEELIVEDCPKIDSLVSFNSFSSKSDPFLPSLKKVFLLELPELVSISSGLCIAPKLERMVIFYCPKLEILSTMEVSSTDLKVIKGEKEWWDALKWYESDLSAVHEDYLARLFIPLRRDGDLMAQLTKD